MRVSPTHHRQLQRVFREVLAAQTVVVLSDEEREDLSWNLADVSCSRSGGEALRAALLAELRHRGVGEDHGEERLPPLVDELVRAVERAPDPADEQRESWWARRRRARAARAAPWCTVEPWGQDDDDRRVLRAVLHAVRPWADQLQTDLLLAVRGQWPPEVAAACDHLHAVSPRHRGDTPAYATTGWLSARDDATWAAFVTFAPHALSADVMTEDARVVVDLSDEGTALVLRLTAEQRSAVEAVLGDRRLVTRARRR